MYKRQPLYRAAYNGHTKITEMLLAKGADANVRDANGWTPMHGAAFKGHAKIVVTLITAKADVNAQDTDGDTPFDWAKSKPEIATLLLKHGAKSGTELKATAK